MPGPATTASPIASHGSNTCGRRSATRPWACGMRPTWPVPAAGRASTSTCRHGASPPAARRSRCRRPGDRPDNACASSASAAPERRPRSRRRPDPPRAPYSDVMTVAWFRHRPARVPAWVVDGGWAVAVAIAVTIAIRATNEPGARPRDLLAYALGWTIGALLLARRRWPLAVLVASSATLQIYYLLDYPGISAAVPLAVALYTAGAAGHLRRGLLIAGSFVAGRSPSSSW